MKRLYINVDEMFTESVDKVKENNRMFSRSMCIRLALHHAALNNIVFINQMPAAMTIASAENKKKAQSKEDWCTAFGGEVKNGVCHIHKYETTFSGHVAKDFRLQSIASFPMDREEFRKSVLENWESVEEAEAAYKAKPIY